MLKINGVTGGFYNSEWKEEWGVVAPETGTRYADATWAKNDEGGVAVYDGATNYVGTIDADGTMHPNDDGSDPVMREMNMTYLRTCLASLS